MKKPAVLFAFLIWFCFFAYAAWASSADEALLAASSRGDTASARAAIEQGASPDARDRLGNTPLIIASDSGYQEIVRLLIFSKASVNAVNKYGYTPLLSAVTSGHRHIATLLVKAGADTKIPNVYGSTAEDHMMARGFFTVGEYISEESPAISAVIDDRSARRGELGGLHNSPWREKFNELLSMDKNREAAEYLVKIASDGNYEASFLLGSLLIKKGDREKGGKWLMEALKSGEPNILYETGIAILKYFPENGAEANVALQKAGKAGFIPAETAYAKNLAEGKGTDKNYEAAYALFSQDMLKDTPEAVYYKGKMKYGGLGTEKDEEGGTKLIKQAADMGYTKAETFLEKLDADLIIKKIASYPYENRKELRAYFTSINAVPIESEPGCDAYDTSFIPLKSYGIVKYEICGKKPGKSPSYYLSAPLKKEEEDQLKEISGGASFITE